MKQFLSFLLMVACVSIYAGQPAPVIRNWYTTNANPLVTVQAGTNCFVTQLQTPTTRTFIVDVPTNGASGGASVFTVSNTVFMSTGGNDTTAARGRIDLPALTLTNALALAQPYDTVFIWNGIYSNTPGQIAYLSNNINLLGQSTEGVVLTGASQDIIFVRGPCSIQQLTVVQTNSGVPIVVDPATDNVTVEFHDMNTLGNFDGIISGGTTTNLNVIVDNCILRGYYDTLALLASGSPTTYTIQNSFLHVFFKAGESQTKRCINTTGGNINLYNCQLTAEDGTSETECLSMLSGNASVYISNCGMQASSTNGGSVDKILLNAGSVTLDGCTVSTNSISQGGGSLTIVPGTYTGQFNNGTLSGPTLIGTVTNTGSTYWTGGEIRTNYATGNWMKYTNGVSSWGLSNNGATITADGTIGVITLAGPAPTIDLTPTGGGSVTIGVGGSTNLLIDKPVTATSFSGIGTSLTALNASAMTSGTVAVGVLPGVAILSNANTFTAANTFSGNITNSGTNYTTGKLRVGGAAESTAAVNVTGDIVSSTFVRGANGSSSSTGIQVGAANTGLYVSGNLWVENSGAVKVGFDASGFVVASGATIVKSGGANYLVFNSDNSVGFQQPIYSPAGTFTNGAFGAYGCATMSTGSVVVATSTSTNQFTGWSYMKTFGGIGSETNSNIVVTNAGDYRISFGCSMLGGNGDQVKTLIYTNFVVCPLIMFEKTMQSPAIAETGFKEFVVTLPALCRVSVYIANLSATSTTIQNICLNVKGAN